MKDFTIRSAALALFAPRRILSVTCHAVAAEQTPNIALIISDDQAWPLGARA